MKIGSLGDILFEVSTDKIQTLRNAQYSGSALIQQHQLHLGTALAEFMGDAAQTFTFSIRVSEYLGASPKDVINKICKYTRDGEALKLVIGKYKIGRNKWLINSYQVLFELYNKVGNFTSADITLTLTEYARGNQ